MRKIPDNIKFAVASAAYQIEGAWNAADKSPSIWDTFCQKPGAIMDGTNGEDTCKSYEYYKRDIEMIKFLGVSVYRFSISWPRLLPDGFANKISKEGTEYYNNLINGLIENGIEPVATMYHWDLPQKLQDLGGWANPDIAVWFEDYARVLYELFGDRVKTWITLNEPKQFAVFGYGMSRFAPALNMGGIAEYLVAKNLLLAHARAWHLYDKEFRSTQKGVCGITIATDYREGETDSPDDVIAGKEAMDFEVGLYSHPIFSTAGGFPESVIRLVGQKSAKQGYPRSRLPELSTKEIKFIKGTSDFYGFNHYSTKFFTRNTYKQGMFPVPSYDDDLDAVFSIKDYKPAAVIHSTAIPWGMRKALKWVKDNCNDPEIMIFENGFGDLGGTDDVDRISYLTRYIDAMLDAIEVDKCNITVYTVWSLMDNFEWCSGLSIKFGIFETDYEDEERKRRPKCSAFWFRHLVATRTLDPGYKALREDLTF
ncbi:myrosinase 1-like [Achroia grisella]|uniref:myrosinase 1-like n=1 Tax=Achroia grisella TaxID=688607 RepID=UPI0027D23651|nr:myrosinase 1-like [Achroia grisella]